MSSTLLTLTNKGTAATDGTDPGSLSLTQELCEHVWHLWTTLLSSLVDTQCPMRIEEIGTDLICTSNFIASRRRQGEVLEPQGLAHALQSASRLSINVQSLFQNGEISGRNHSKFLIDKAAHRQPCQMVCRSMANLKDLNLCFDMAPSSGLELGYLVSQIDLSNITSFVIACAMIEESTLRGIVGRLTQSRKLRLELLDLIAGSWQPILRTLMRLEDLESLHLRNLSQRGYEVVFLDQDKRVEEYNERRAYAGSHAVMADSKNDCCDASKVAIDYPCSDEAFSGYVRIKAPECQDGSEIRFQGKATMQDKIARLANSIRLRDTALDYYRVRN